MAVSIDANSDSVEVGNVVVEATLSVYEGTIVDARILLDGRRAGAAERVLLGAPPHIAVLAAAARAAISEPRAERAIVRLLLDLTE